MLPRVSCPTSRSVAVVAQADRERHRAAGPGGPAQFPVDEPERAGEFSSASCPGRGRLPLGQPLLVGAARPRDQARGVGAPVRAQHDAGPSVRTAGQPGAPNMAATSSPSPPAVAAAVRPPWSRRGGAARPARRARSGRWPRPARTACTARRPAAARCNRRRAARRRTPAGTRAARAATSTVSSRWARTLGRNTGSAPASIWMTGRASTSKPISAAPGSPGRQTTGTPRAGRPEPSVPYPSEPHGVQRTLGEPHRAVPAEDPPDHVARPGAGTAGGDDQVGAQPIWSSSRPRSALRVVVADARPGTRARRPRRRRRRARASWRRRPGRAGWPGRRRPARRRWR